MHKAAANERRDRRNKSRVEQVTRAKGERNILYYVGGLEVS